MNGRGIKTVISALVTAITIGGPVVGWYIAENKERIEKTEKKHEGLEERVRATEGDLREIKTEQKYQTQTLEEIKRLIQQDQRRR